MRIGAVARKAGIRPSAIRFYERVGVLPPASRRSGQRHFGSDVTRHLAVIEFARKAGFTIAEIKLLFNGFKEVRPASMRWKELAQKKWTEMESQIERLKGMQRLLEKSTQCRCIKLDDCGRMMLAQSHQGPEAPCGGSLSKSRSKRSTIRLKRGVR
jgi:MerR family transcriptional regulator, redox-sensitive transcriptional activator SoxR